jgi:hypothetical protein
VALAVSPALALPIALDGFRVGLPVLARVIGMAVAPFLLAVPADLVVFGISVELVAVIFPVALPLAIVLAIAGGVLIYALRRKGKRPTSIYLMGVSLAVVSLAFAVDRKFTNVMTVSKYQMEWSINAEAPWGEVSPATEDGQPLVVLYRRVADSYCYDALHSSELKGHLAGQSKGSVTVEYNTFSDFGRRHRQDIRSVDGVLINERERSAREPEEFGAQVLGENPNPPSCW